MTPFEPDPAASHATLERTLVTIWEALLGLPDQVGLDDNFFELGGHSLLVVELAAALSDATGVEVPVFEIFDGPTPRACAAAISARLERARPIPASPAASTPAPAPNAGAAGSTAEGAGLERIVVAAFERLLGLEGQVGPEDSFFELGGHSLLVVELATALGEATGVDLAVMDVFEAPTPRGCAARLAALGASAAVAAAAPTIEHVRPAPAEDNASIEIAAVRAMDAAELDAWIASWIDSPSARAVAESERHRARAGLSPAAARALALLLDQVERDARPQFLARRAIRRPIPALPIVASSMQALAETAGQETGRLDVIGFDCRLHGPLDPDALAAALDLVVERHPILNSRISRSGGRIFQTPGGAPPRLDVDLGASDRASAEARAAAQVRRVLYGAYDLEAEPPLRAALVRIAPDEHHLALGVMHTAFDGGSVPVLDAYLERALLHVLGRGELDERPFSYFDLALWRQEAMMRRTGHAELAHWRDRLADLEPLRVPGAGAEGAFPRGSSRVELDEAATRALRAAAGRHRQTVYAALFAATARWIGELCGQDGAAIPTTFSPRHGPLETMVGYLGLVRILRLRSIAGDPRTLIAAASEVMRETRENAALELEPNVLDAATMAAVEEGMNLIHLIDDSTRATSIQGTTRPTRDWAGLRRTDVPEERDDVVRRLLTVFCYERRHTIEVVLDWDASRVDPATREARAASLRRVLLELADAG